LNTPSIPSDRPRLEVSWRSVREEDDQAVNGRKREDRAAGTSRDDSVEFTARTQIEAARGPAVPSIALNSSSAAAAAIDTAAQILAYPAAAARAQANNDGASVLAMLQ
jgi:hypothetical protein